MFGGSTPYFNEHEFSQKLSKCVKDYSKVPFFLIILKGTNYNKITSQHIEFYLLKLRHSWGVGTQNAEYFSIKGINFESRLKPAKAKSKSKTKKRVNQNEESKDGNNAILLSEVPKFIYKVGNESQIDDWRLLSANILLTNKDLQKIDF